MWHLNRPEPVVEAAAPAPVKAPRIAIIDIGSNSVRLVVFDGPRRHPRQIFNEKALCGLGRAVGKTGRMDEEAMDRALATLARFAALFEPMQIDRVVAVATAAIRDADNGPAFVKRVKRHTGIDIETIPGEEEARLSAFGVIAGIPQACGVVGDLGGGSLELVAVADGQIHERASLSIGPVRLLGDVGDDAAAQKPLIKDALARVDWLKAWRGTNFYVVGGAWRAISRIQMVQKNWPLPILHGFALSGTSAAETAALISRQHPEGLKSIQGVPERRVEALPTAARILAAVLKLLEPAQLVSSSFGLREGLLFDRLEIDPLAQDPFLVECRELAELAGRYPEHGETLMRWLDPLYDQVAESEEDRRLRFAACLLADISWRGHPDFRAERAVMEVLYGRFVGVDHPGRAFVALALNQAYGANADTGLGQVCLKLLDEERAAVALRLGLALRLAQRVSAGTQMILEQTKLRLTETQLVLCFAPDAAALRGEMVERRLAKLAQALQREPAIEADGA
ncbi:MAG: Ppx/GppA family phosphatase [Rhodothalassiaceae bacterium]